MSIESFFEIMPEKTDKTVERIKQECFQRILNLIAQEKAFYTYKQTEINERYNNALNVGNIDEIKSCKNEMISCMSKIEMCDSLDCRIKTYPLELIT